MKRFLLFAAALVAVLGTAPRAQMHVVPIDELQGHVTLGLALRHLANTGIYMMATAHPDDENNGLLVMLNRGQGVRTALATATRGNGGQNEIGPELFEPLGVLRTEELAAMHRFDGAEQYFTRAVDFGFSIDIPETLEKWGRDEIVGDYVRLIRMVRPDVVTSLNPAATGPGQHAHHAAAAILSHEAYELAADPTKYPEQIREGLRPWQPRKFYYATGFGGGGGTQPPAAGRTTRIDLAGYDRLLGKTYSEIGIEARSMHKCQGQAQLLALPAPSAATFQLAASTVARPQDRDEKSLFDDIDTSIAGLAKFAGDRPPRDLVEGLAAVGSAVQAAQRAFEAAGDQATVQPLLAGLRAVRVLRGQIRAMSLDDTARYEIEFRLRQKESEFQQAVLIAGGVRVEALADDGVVVPGQPLRVSVVVANRGPAELNVRQVRFDGFEGDGACLLTGAVAAPGPGGFGGRGGRGGAAAPSGPALSALRTDQVGRCDVLLRIPASSRVSEPYWQRAGEAGRYTFDPDAPFGLPYRLTPFYAQVTLGFPGGEDVIKGLPVQYRYEGNIFSGEKRMDLLVAPAFSVAVSPDVALIPAASAREAAAPGTTAPPAGRAGARPPAAGRAGTAGASPAGRGRSSADRRAPAEEAAAAREIRVTVVNDTPGAAETLTRIDLPPGWTAAPAEQSLAFTRQDESRTARFQVRPAPGTAPGEYHVRAAVSSGGQTFDRGYQVIEYEHIRRQHIYNAADATIKVMDVRIAPNLTVGYIMGSGDEVPPVIEQLGARLEMIGPDVLAWGDLSRFDTIVVGIRAYERRDDLRANNSRLLEYVRNGGTVVVQYNRATVGDAYGPYPAQVSNNRVTDEFAPVQILEPDHPVFTTPNAVSGLAWRGWVQERGLSFLGEKDSRYRDLVQLTDSFANNPGDKRGALVEASYGRGRWLYIALGLWRQLPAGVDGAHQILANLISLGKIAPAGTAVAEPASTRPAAR